MRQYFHRCPPRMPACGLFLSLLLAPMGAQAKGPIQSTPKKNQLVASATSTEITHPSQLIGGPAAQGRAGVGDYLLQNDHIRVIIRGPNSRTVSSAMFGGHIIDADIVRENGEGKDQFGQLSTFASLTYSINAESVEPMAPAQLRNGEAGVEACGPLDLFDFVDLENAFALVPPLLKLLPYDFDAETPIYGCNRFILGADNRHVEIITELYNDSDENFYIPVGDLVDTGSDVELWLQNGGAAGYGRLQNRYTWGGFGEQPFSQFNLMGFFADDVTYGYVAPMRGGDKLDAMSMSIAGVTGTILGSTNLTAVLTGKKWETFEVPAGGSRSYDRYFIVGERDIGDVTDELWKLQEMDTVDISGTIRDQISGEAIPRVRVTFLVDGDEERPITQFFTDENGEFSGQIPEGTYGVIMADGFDLLENARPSELVPINVTVGSDGKVLNLFMKSPSYVTLSAWDGNAPFKTRSLPARVGFYGDDHAPPSSQLMDITDDPYREGLAKEVILTENNTTVALKPGTYDVVFTRGVEYDRVVIPDVIFSANNTTELEAILTQVIDSDGYLSADLHVHAMNSPDSPVNNENRVRTFAADGVDLLVSTDHDFITNYRPTVEALGLDDRLTSLMGLEITTFAMGHFNAYPLVADPEHRIGGAIDWADNDYIPLDADTGEIIDVGQDTSLPSHLDNLSPSQFLEVAERGFPGLQARQLNHPRGDLQGYFTSIGLDLSALGTDAETQVDPTTLRVADGADLFDPESFEVIEVLNTDVAYGTSMTVLNDAFALANLGYPKAMSAVSDTHYITHILSGGSRSWVGMEVDDPGLLNQSETFADDFALGMGTGAVTASNGPFITAEVVNSAGQSGMMGDLVSATNGQVDLNIRIQNPKWVSYERVGIFVNSPAEGNFDTEKFNDPGDLNPTAVLRHGVDFTSSPIPVDSSNSDGTIRREANISLDLDLAEDSWITVVVWGGQAQIYGDDALPTLGFTSPILVDVNGNGQFDGPCADMNPGEGCDLVRPPQGGWPARDMERNHHNEWVFDLWEIFQQEMAANNR